MRGTDIAILELEVKSALKLKVIWVLGARYRLLGGVGNA